LLRSFSATTFAIFSPSSHQAYRLAEPKLAERRLVEPTGESSNQLWQAVLEMSTWGDILKKSSLR
jgi:hypothetical protein